MSIIIKWMTGIIKEYVNVDDYDIDSVFLYIVNRNVKTLCIWFESSSDFSDYLEIPLHDVLWVRCKSSFSNDIIYRR